MVEFKGIVLYNIEADNNLNGVYTNNHPLTNNRIFAETARFIPDESSENGETEIRVYDCFYFDTEGEIECTLTFSITNGIIDVVWSIGQRVIFRGQGFQMNERQIAISYWFNA